MVSICGISTIGLNSIELSTDAKVVAPTVLPDLSLSLGILEPDTCAYFVMDGNNFGDFM